MKHATIIAFCALFGVLITLTACEETVDPIVDSDRQLTLWGTLDMNADRQFIRVIPIREILDPRLASIPPLEVTSTDLVNGEQVTWHDSTITFVGDRPALLYYADLRVAPMHTYRIEISSPDLAYVTSAETTIPKIPTAEIFPEEVVGHISPSGFRVTGLQDVTWHDIDRMPYEIEHWYRFLNFNGLGFIDVKLPFTPPSITYDYRTDRLDMTLNLVRHRDSLQKKIPLAAVRLVGMGQTITVLDDSFRPPGGEFDAELLAQPGTMSNVLNGFGFIGSIGRFSVEWMLADSSASLLNYIPLSGFRGSKAGELDERVVRLADHPWEERAERVISERRVTERNIPDRY